MKALLMGMLISAAVGPVILVEVNPGSTWASEFSFAMIGGTGGMLLCLTLYETADVKHMARDAIGNLLTAACFGPAAAFWFGNFMKIEMCPQLIIPVSATLGFCGASLVRAAKPIWLKAWASWNSRRARMLGDDETE